MTDADFIVIGGGIAGLSAAAELALDARVILLEMEAAPGYHSTGRSAAYFAPGYGNAVVRAITSASESFFHNPPKGFTDVPLIKPRGRLYVGRSEQQHAVEAMRLEFDDLTLLGETELIHRVDILKGLTSGLFSESGGDIDVDALLQGYIRRFTERGGQLEVKARVLELARADGRWQVSTETGIYKAATLINAAGAWADEVASLAGLEPVGIQPKRRTALLVDAPRNLDIRDWPIVVDIDEQFYFKPDAGQLLISPADETPSPACDAQPEELDIAIAVDRFMGATTHKVTRVNHQWAGLRSFAPDNTFVLGHDLRATGFFWLAGQGGYGVQSSPGMSQLVAHALLGRSIDEKLGDQLTLLRPDRLIE